MANKRRKQCGKPECKRAWQAGRMRDFYATHKNATGTTYNARYADKRAETDKAYRSSKPHWRRLYPKLAIEMDERRRKRLAFNGEVEAFDPGDIFRRDRWNCGICHHPIAPDLAYPDPMSASVDHVVPLAEGGAHTRANVRASHLLCNTTRGTRALNDQLALIG